MSQPLHGYFQLNEYFFSICGRHPLCKISWLPAPPGRDFLRLLCLSDGWNLWMSCEWVFWSRTAKKCTIPIQSLKGFFLKRFSSNDFRFISPTEQDIRSALVVNRLRNMLLPGTFSSWCVFNLFEKYLYGNLPQFSGFKKKSLKAPPSYLVLLKFFPLSAHPFPHFPFTWPCSLVGRSEVPIQSSEVPSHTWPLE